MKKIYIILFIICSAANLTTAQTITTDSIESVILNRRVATTVILPAGYDTTRVYPVLYLLHWWGGNNESFLETNLPTELKNRQIIVVTPDAGTCWYVNSFSDPAAQYESFMTKELFTYIDKKYKTDPSWQGIGGFSMGGYGALLVGLKHPGRFTFIADMCGAINAPFYDIPLTPESPLNFIMSSVREAFGDENSYQSRGTDVFEIVSNMKKGSNQFVYMAMATKDEFDFIVPQHQKLKKELDKKKIKYHYIEIEGGHFDGIVFSTCLPEMLDQFTKK